MANAIYTMPNRVQFANRIWRNMAVYKGRLIRGNMYVSNGSSATHTAPYTAQTRHYKRLLFAQKLLTRSYDEFDHRYYNNGDTGERRTIPFQEIRGYFITHDIGDGQNDYLADSIVVDCQFDTRRYHGYHYANSFNDPSITLRPRAPSMGLAEQPLADPAVDLVATNLTARPGRNIFQSYRQMPIDSGAQGEGGDESSVTSSDDFGPARESIALVVPFMRFRRARLEFESFQKVVRVRGLTFKIVELPRRTFG